MGKFQGNLVPLVPPADPSKAVVAETWYVVAADGGLIGMVPNDQLLDSMAFVIDDPAESARVAGIYAVDSNADGTFEPSPTFPLVDAPTPNVSRSFTSFVRLPDTAEVRRGIFRLFAK